MPKLVRLTGQMHGYWKPASEEDMEALVGMTELKVSGNKARSRKMNNCLHKWCDEIADTLNNHGLDQRVVLKPGIPIPWDGDDVKEKLWRPLQIAITGKESTTDPSNADYIRIQEYLIAKLVQMHGVEVEWPSIDRMMRQSA